jgi:hypothetical protein
LESAEEFGECPLGFSLDVTATGAAVAVGRRQVATGGGIEDEDSTFEATKAVCAEVARGNIAEAEVHEEGLAAVVETAMGKDVVDVVVRQIALRQTPTGVLRYHIDSRFPHRSDPPTWYGPTLDSWSLAWCPTTSYCGCGSGCTYIL